MGLLFQIKLKNHKRKRTCQDTARTRACALCVRVCVRVCVGGGPDLAAIPSVVVVGAGGVDRRGGGGDVDDVSVHQLALRFQQAQDPDGVRLT